MRGSMFEKQGQRCKKGATSLQERNDTYTTLWLIYSEACVAAQ